MRHNNASLRHKFANLRRQFVDRLHPIVYKVRLPTALELHLNRGPDELLIELRNDGLDSHAILGRRLDHAHIAQPDQRHMQRSRNRCR